jgi:hypothetical protein
MSQNNLNFMPVIEPQREDFGPKGLLALALKGEEINE